MSNPHRNPSEEDTLLTLGEQVESRSDALRALSTCEALLDRPTFAAFGELCRDFGLDLPGSAILAGCVWRTARGDVLPDAAQIRQTRLWLGASDAEPSLLLSDGDRAALELVCGAVLDRPPELPAWMSLDLCPNRPLFHSADILEEMDRFLERIPSEPSLCPAAVILTGEAGSGKRFLFSQLCCRRGAGLLLIRSGVAALRDIPLIYAASVLLSAMICLEDYHTDVRLLMTALHSRFRVLLAVSEQQHPLPGDGVSALLRRSPRAMSPDERLTAMHMLFPTLPEEALAHTASLYRMSIGRLTDAAIRFRAECVARREPTDIRTLCEILRRENAPALLQNAERLVTNKRMTDLVLPAEQTRQLMDLCDVARLRDKVWKSWGFEQKIPYGQGVTALFYGASGTGKTLAAGVIANELGLDLYRVDLSQLLSKYIGETQKNIGKIFDDAQNSDCILFFDEADALFSRRSDSGDAQDRYANAEVAYLLQRTEQYDGIILLATNLLQNFDEAFRRRIDFMIRFPSPDAALRDLLWRSIFPAQAPTAALDFPLLAEQLELSGAGIRSAALHAACLAAAAGESIDMTRVVTAAISEYQKMGKPFPSKLISMFPQERR